MIQLFISHRGFNPRYILAVFILLITQNYFCQTPTWSIIATQAPNYSGGLMLLLSDGSVICKTSNGGADGVGNMWDKLTPDINGSYINGTWSSIASMNDTRLYFSSQTMKDGRIYVAGGEYGTGGSKGEIYDPVSNSWTSLSAPNTYMGDANSALLDNGKILQATLVTSLNKTLLFNPVTNIYSGGPNCLGGHDESTWLKLPDNSILFININSVNSERYIPSLNQWIADATVPSNLYDPYGSETGPAFLLPNGKAIYLGSLGNTAIYTPSGNNSPGSWVAGPQIPGGNGMPDATGAMMADGKIIFTAGPVPTGTATLFNSPTYFYQYDYLSNSFSAITAPGGGPTLNSTAYESNMLDLPDGTVMFSRQGSKSYYVRAPAGAPLAVGKPTITNVAQVGCLNTFTLTGTLFNGICEGACYGDDWQMNTNFPLVRLTSGTNVYYARTYNWNRTAVQTGSLADTTLFTLPATIPNGTYSLSVIANGNSSDPVTFTFSPFPVLTSPLFLPDICSGNTFSYSATTSSTNTTLMWTRPAVPGIANTAITTPQSANPNEILINTSAVAKTAVYSYTLTNGSCATNYQVSVVVNPVQSIVISGNTAICANAQTTLQASGVNTYSWSTGAGSSSITVSPSITSTYSVSGYNSFGCFCVRQVTVTIKPLPTLTITGPSTICVGDAVVLTASGNSTFFSWSTGDISNTISVQPTSTTSYSVITSLNGCQKSDSINIVVLACTGLKINGSEIISCDVYPNPFSDKLNVETIIQKSGIYSIKIYDTFGRILKEDVLSFIPGKNVTEIEMINSAKGVYMLILQKDNTVFKSRIIKE